MMSSFLDEGEVLVFHLDVLLLMRHVINTHLSLFDRPMQVNFFADHVALLLPHANNVALLRDQKLKLVELRSYVRSLRLPGDSITAVIYTERNRLKSASLPPIHEMSESQMASQRPDSIRRRDSYPALFQRQSVLPPIVTTSHKDPLNLLPERMRSC